MKNYSPGYLSFMCSVGIAAFTVITMFLVKLNNDVAVIWWMLILIPALVFFFSYLVLQFMLKRFIHGRIKLIYKTISEFKSAKSKKEFTVDLEQDVLSSVENEVYRWTKNKRKEILEQKKQEEYRKQFVSNVSHELKTPIFSIEGYLETLIDGAIDDSEVNLKYLKRALSNTERLSVILKDLDMISSLQSDMMELDFESIRLDQLVQEVIESLHFLAEKHNVQVVFSASNDKSIVVEGDRLRIKQVLVNLISNSIKYGNEGGITEIAWYDIEDNALIEVSDNGIGIEKQHLQHLFERFYRVDKNRSREMGGTGLGLAIVKHIVEAHYQTINVRSTPGVGTTFGFTLLKV